VLEQVGKPGAPGVSRADPTWYHVFTLAIGAEWSSWTMTVRPFGSRNIS
jgi:hypothetical protein